MASRSIPVLQSQRSFEAERVSPGKSSSYNSPETTHEKDTHHHHTGMSIGMLFFWLVLIFIIVFIILLLLRPVWALTPEGTYDLGKIALTSFVVALFATLIIWIVRACATRKY